MPRLAAALREEVPPGHAAIAFTVCTGGRTTSMLIMICDSRSDRTDRDRLSQFLIQSGHRVESFSAGGDLLEAVVARRPDVVVYVLGANIEHDLYVLQLLRRMQHQLDLILLADVPSLRVRTAMQPLRPIYYAVAPADPAELIEVVESARRRRERAV